MSQPSVPYPTHEQRPPLPDSGVYSGSTIDKAPPGTLPSELLELVRRRPEWHQRAACRGEDTAQFFVARGESTAPAKALCATCPVQQECRDFALSLPLTDCHGVWGGTSQKERKRLRRRSAA